MSQRKLKLVVISDIHLGTYGCQAKPLLSYLKSIDPETYILNGDIIDIWQFNKRYFPKSHLKIINYFLKEIQKGKRVYYLIGNHDEALRRFIGFKMQKLEILNKKVLKLDGKKAWFFHGDVFDVTMQYSKWITKLGGVGYDLLIVLNSLVNNLLERMGKDKLSLSKTVKNKVKSALSYINLFEEVAINIAKKNEYDYVVCGHIHHPNIKKYMIGGKEITYLNSGDWVENLTALEYQNKKWSIHHFEEDSSLDKKEKIDQIDKSSKELFEELINEFKELDK
ncbi:UDP-2,3-diacylglucosamine diphosphatase [Flavobacteriaceae bacterium]|nr:UDP-2,3-diacylglucosamine diphosphatase [Flavobacteriaceae bacterium]